MKTFEFESGNATPKGEFRIHIENGNKMYTGLSDETKEFFEFMMENELIRFSS